MLTLCSSDTEAHAEPIIAGMSGGSSVLEALTGRWENYTSLTCWFWVVFSALGPGALAAYLQTVGQETCTPSQAQVPSVSMLF